MAAPDRYMEHTSYKHILKYTSVFGTIQGLNILVAMIRNKLVAVILGPGGMGLIALFNSTRLYQHGCAHERCEDHRRGL